MADAKKIVVKATLDCEKCKKRVLKTAAQVEGVDSMSVDKDSKLTVIGNADPVCLVKALRKFGFAEIISVGPAKEPEKPKTDDKKKDVPKKDEPKKDQGKNDGGKKDEGKKEAAPPCKPAEYIIVMPPQCHCFSDENPNSCSIS